MKMNNLNHEIWKYFLLFSILILSILWSFQGIFFDKYYEYTKIQDAKHVASIINNNQDLNNLQNLMNNKLNTQKKSFDEYKVGVQVLHTKFGVGTIIKTDNAGGNNYVSVDFGTLGVKTLSLNFAPLQILKK